MIRLSATALGTAAFAMMATTPAAAAELPPAGAIAAPVSAASVRVLTGQAEDANWRRRCGWRGCRGRRGIGAGDVLAGVLVLGGIAAIASAASSNRRERVVERVPPPQPVRRDDRRDYRSANGSGSGIDRAVDMCMEQVERGNTRIDSVDNASRTGDGWRVSGSLERGGGWNCWIDNDGRIREIDLGDRYSYDDSGYGGDDAYLAAEAGGEGEGQLSDEAYLSARANLRDRPETPLVDADLAADGPLPAYPGGPLPGEEGYEEALASRDLAAR